MSDTLRVCLDCGDLTPATRCEACQSERDRRINQQRGGAHARGYTRSWQRTAAHVKQQQPVCEVCGSTADLTVDHITPKARGGTDAVDNLRTLCRRHNSAKGARP